MTELVRAVLIAVVQGLTEWLPVSSSGHLVLVEKLLGFSGGLEFDVALHFGTLMAVFVYFGKDIVDILRDLLSGRWGSENGRLGLLVIVATIPAAVVGYFLRDIFISVFSDLWIVVLGFGVSGLFLMIASIPPRRPNEHYTSPPARPRGNEFFNFSYWRAFVVGVAQIFALFPGVSRSGSTFGAGLLSGLNEKNALKFSFLMSIPIIFGANVLAIGNRTLEPSLVWATLVSFVVGLIAIHVLYKIVLTNRKNLRWFAGYALLLAAVLGIALIVS